MSGSTYAAGAGALRGRYAGDQPGRRARRGLRLPHRGRAGPDRRPRAAAHGPAAGRPARPRRAYGSSGRTRPSMRGVGGQLRGRRDPPARRRPVAGRPRHRGPGRAPLRRPGLPPLRRAGDRPRLVLPLQHRGRDRPPAGRSGSRSRRSGPHEWSESMYQEIILDHYRNPHHKGLRDAVRRRGAPRQPDLRRRGHPAGAGRRRRRSSRRVLRRSGLLDQPGQHLGDDRPGDRPERRGRAGQGRRVPGAHAEPGHARAGRGRARGRHRLRRRVALPGPGEVRAAGLDGVEGRDRTGGRGRREESA